MNIQYTIEQIKPFVEKFIEVEKIEFCGSGDDSEAFCVNDRIVFKFPKNKEASDCLRNEIILLKNIQNIFQIEIPNVMFEDEFKINGDNFIFFGSLKLDGKNMTKEEFMALGKNKFEKAAETIACFLKTLHSINMNETNREMVLLHGDFSLDHILFQNGEVSGVLDFADSHIGNYEKDFMYLLDDEDPDEFGKEFGEMVLKNYDLLSFDRREYE